MNGGITRTVYLLQSSNTSERAADATPNSGRAIHAEVGRLNTGNVSFVRNSREFWGTPAPPSGE